MAIRRLQRQTFVKIFHDSQILSIVDNCDRYPIFEQIRTTFS